MMARRRSVLKGLDLAMAAGPASVAAEEPGAPAAARPGPAPRYFTPDEMDLIAAVAVEVLPLPDVRDGTVSVARNLDAYLARFPGYDLGRIRKGIRFLNASLTYALARVLGQATALDRVAVSKYLVTLGYYGEANGEADLVPAARRIWPRMGYPGPLGAGFPGFVPAPAALPEDRLPDLLGGADPLAFLAARRILAR